MSLFKWELTKIWRRKSTKISLFILVAYAVFSTIYNSVVNLASSIGSTDGIAEIARQYEFADKYRGELTEEKLLEAYHNILTAYSEENLVPNEFDSTLNPSQEVWDKYVVPLGTMQYVLRNLYSFLPEFSYFNSILDVPENEIKSFYSVRDKAAEDWLYSCVSNEKDREYFIMLNGKVQTPFHYDWYAGQQMYLEMIVPIPIIAAFACIVFTAPIFAAEYSERTAPVILSAKHGRRKITFAKLGAAFTFTSIAYLSGVGVYILGQLYFLGVRGLECPVQFIKPYSFAPITIGQAELYQIILGFISCVSITLLTAFVSSAVHSAFPAVIIPAAVIISGFMSGLIPESLEFIAAWLPFVGNYTAIFGMNMYFHIWQPYYIIISPVIISTICLPWAVYKFTHHQTA